MQKEFTITVAEGDKAVVIDNISGHSFAIGQHVTILEIQGDLTVRDNLSFDLVSQEGKYGSVLSKELAFLTDQL